MDDLPPHVGRDVVDEIGYALVCTAVGPGGNPHADPLCGKPAVVHVRWEPETTENGFACADHAQFAATFRPYQTHSVANSACGMPGSVWMDTEDGGSVCEIIALDGDPDRSGHIAAVHSG